MKDLSQFVKESMITETTYYNDEVRLMARIVLFDNDDKFDEQDNDFVDELWDIISDFEWENRGIGKFYFYANKNITKEQDETLKKLSKLDRHYKYRPKENVNPKDMIDGIKKDWGVKNWDDCKKYEDKRNSVYMWDNGIYVSSVYGQVCIYQNGEM